MENSNTSSNHFLTKNLSYLPQSLQKKILSLEGNSPYVLEPTKDGHPSLSYGKIWLHSKHSPIKEAERLVQELPYDGSNRVYLFIGAGLGYSVLKSLITKENVHAVWLEEDLYILQHALECNDFSEFLKTERLQILISPITENDLYEAFRGKSTWPVTLIPHRGCFQLKEKEYNHLKYLVESFFQKKDVNLATLIRFEKVWTRNFLNNLPATLQMQPVSNLFGIAKCPILIVGAGPSLEFSIESILKYRECFLLIAVDTAVPILQKFSIDPDFIYTVDPQVINNVYLEDYQGQAYLVLDPTATYLTTRLPIFYNKTFFTNSPFPLTKIFEKLSSIEIGKIPFGGSVSTNAYSLAVLMKGAPIYLVGQDLAFSFGQAHARGAAMEERVQLQENRRYRMELHNYKQIHYLPKYQVNGFTEVNQETKPITLITNEKMLIFQKWFSDNAKEAKNLTHTGIHIHGMEKVNFYYEFQDQKKNNEYKLQVEKAKKSIQLALQKEPWTSAQILKMQLENLKKELENYIQLVEKGYKTSKEIYNEIKKGPNHENPKIIQQKIQFMNQMDEKVSSHKELGDILSTSMQRVIYSITEGYDKNLTIEEKENPHLSIAKKSLLLYEGLYYQAKELKKLIHKNLISIQEN